MSLTGNSGVTLPILCRLGLAALLLMPAPSLAVELISAVQNGPTVSEHPNDSAEAGAISGDGRYILYSSTASNITSQADLNGHSDLFIYDRQTDTARNLTISANGASHSARFTNNESSIVFRSTATNLLNANSSQSPANTERYFLYNLATDQIELLDPNGLLTGQNFVLANNARTFAWSAQDDAGSWHIVVADRLTAEQRQIGDGSDVAYNVKAFSGDSRYLLFDSQVVGNSSADSDVFLADVEAGTTRLLTGSLVRYSVAVDINSDGSLVLIQTSSENVPPPPLRGNYPLTTVVINVATGALEFVENTVNNGRAKEISDDGRFIRWDGEASFNSSREFVTLHVKDRLTNTEVHVTEGHIPFGDFSNISGSLDTFLSADGSTLVFSSYSNKLVEPAYATTRQIFAYDTASGQIQKISKRNNQPLAFGGDLPSYLPSISDDGRRVAFASKSQSLVPGINNVFPSNRTTEWGPRNITDHVYLRDRSAASTATITGSSTDEPAPLIFGYSYPHISRDGRYIGFSGGRLRDRDLYYDAEQGLLINERDGLGVNLYDASVQFDASGTWLIYRSSDILDDRNPQGLNGLFLHNLAEDTTRIISYDPGSGPFTPAYASINATGTHLFIRYPIAGRSELGWRYYDISSDTLEPLFHEDTTEPEPNQDWPVVLLGDTGLVLYQAGSPGTQARCYLHDRATGSTTRLAPEWSGSSCYRPQASNNGQRIIFRTAESTAGTDQRLVMEELMLFDRALDRLITISSPVPERIDYRGGGFRRAQISGNGEVVVFESAVENLAPDGNGVSDVFAVEVADLLNANNQPPVAITQNTYTPINEALVVFLTARDEDSDPLDYLIVRQPEHGRLTGAHPNTLYTPNPDFRGIDRFEFVVTDGITTSPHARVTIEVAESPACANGCPQLLSAVLPGSRSVTPNSNATAFATVINPSAANAFDCGISLNSNPNVDFQFQATDPASNAVLGAPNELVDIAPGAAQSFVLSLLARTNFDAEDVQFQFGCANMTAAQVRSGLNTLELSASESPTPDVIAIALTPTADGIAQVGKENYGIYAVATSNVGAAGTISVRPFANSFFDGDALICETEPATGTCISPPASSVQSDMAAGSTHSFGLFVRSNSDIALNPAEHRHFVYFTDSANKRRGSTSVAVTTR